MVHQKFVFIGGLHRSGTSLVHRILREHPDVSGFEGTDSPQDEGQHLQSVFPTARACGGPGRFGLNPGGHLTEADAAQIPAARKDLLSQWGRYWDLRRPVLVEKSPPNIVRTRFLQALFENSWFVMVVRHPLVSCMATLKWVDNQPLESLVEHWLRCHELLIEDASYVRHLHVLQYEALCRAPDEQLRELADFVGIAPSMSAGQVDTGASDRYFLEWDQMRGGLLGRRRTQRLIHRYERRVHRFGYSLEDFSRTEVFDLGRG